MEDYWLGMPRSGSSAAPEAHAAEVVDLHMPAEGIFHNLVFVSIDKQYPGQAYKVMNGLWGQGRVV